MEFFLMKPAGRRVKMMISVLIEEGNAGIEGNAH